MLRQRRARSKGTGAYTKLPNARSSCCTPWLPLEKIKTIFLGMARLSKPTGFSHIHVLFLNSQSFTLVALLRPQHTLVLPVSQPHATLAHTDPSRLNV